MDFNDKHLVATSLHPLEADPNDPEAAFAEYAADDLWVATHLGQFIAVAEAVNDIETPRAQ